MRQQLVEKVRAFLFDLRWLTETGLREGGTKLKVTGRGFLEPNLTPSKVGPKRIAAPIVQGSGVDLGDGCIALQCSRNARRRR
jgi:hypothetical protein